MNTLLAMVRNVALLVLISSFWEMLAPEGKLRQTVRLVIGLLLISCIVVPITDVLSRGAPEINIDFPELSDTQAVLAEGEAIAEAMETVARTQYEEELARQVASLCLLADGVAEVRVALVAEEQTGNIKQVYLQVEAQPGATGERVEEKLVNLVSTFYGLAESNIECYVKEAASDDTTEATDATDGQD